MSLHTLTRRFHFMFHGATRWALGATLICLIACGCQRPASCTLRTLKQIIERSMGDGYRDSFSRTDFAY
ncbi:MAG: hypothetical protein ACHQ4H_11895 [Ktedonobacterales bacterium]